MFGKKDSEQLTLVGMDLQIELGEEQLAEVEQSHIHIPALDDLLNELMRQRLLGLVMARHLLKDLGLPAPILQHLRRRFDEIASDGGAVEPGVLGLAEEAMEDVAHLMEEGDDVVVSHESGLVRSGLSEVGDHRGEGVGARTVFLGVAAKQGPDGGMRVL